MATLLANGQLGGGQLGGGQLGGLPNGLGQPPMQGVQNFAQLTNHIETLRGARGNLALGPIPTASGRSNDTKTSSAYASRHQAAEQRRRSRINERLERLRQIVPKAERANTATILELAIEYIVHLQDQVAQLSGRPLAEAVERARREEKEGAGAGGAQQAPSNLSEETRGTAPGPPVAPAPSFLGQQALMALAGGPQMGGMPQGLGGPGGLLPPGLNFNALLAAAGHPPLSQAQLPGPQPGMSAEVAATLAGGHLSLGGAGGAGQFLLTDPSSGQMYMNNAGRLMQMQGHGNLNALAAAAAAAAQGPDASQLSALHALQGMMPMGGMGGMVNPFLGGMMQMGGALNLGMSHMSPGQGLGPNAPTPAPNALAQAQAQAAGPAPALAAAPALAQAPALGPAPAALELPSERAREGEPDAKRPRTEAQPSEGSLDDLAQGLAG